MSPSESQPPGEAGPPQPADPGRPGGRRPLSPRAVVLVALLALASSGLADNTLAAHQFTLALIYVPPLLALAWLAGWRFAATCTAAAAVINFGVDAAVGGSLANPWLIHAGNLAVFILCVPAERGVAIVRFMLETARRGEVRKPAIHAIRVGQRVVLVPVRRREDAATVPTQSGDVPVLLDPGQAAAAGAHPATVLGVGLLEKFVQPGARVLDLACGPGILSLAALKLGAVTVLAADRQSESVQATLANARLNELSGRLEIRLGALEEVLAPLVARGTQLFDITLADASSPEIVVDGLKAGLARTLAPDGVLILSGFKPEQEGRLRAGLDEAGLEVVERRELEAWLALASRRQPGQSTLGATPRDALAAA